MLKINELTNIKRTPSKKYTFAESVRCKVIELDFGLSVNEINLKKYITDRVVSESSNNKEGFFKKIWNAIKKFFQWIGTFFNNIWRRIKIFIKKLIRKFRRRKKEKGEKQTVVSTSTKSTQPTEPPKEMKHYTKKDLYDDDKMLSKNDIHPDLMREKNNLSKINRKSIYIRDEFEPPRDRDYVSRMTYRSKTIVDVYGSKIVKYINNLCDGSHIHNTITESINNIENSIHPNTLLSNDEDKQRKCLMDIKADINVSLENIISGDSDMFSIQADDAIKQFTNFPQGPGTEYVEEYIEKEVPIKKLVDTVYDLFRRISSINQTFKKIDQKKLYLDEQSKTGNIPWNYLAECVSLYSKWQPVITKITNRYREIIIDLSPICSESTLSYILSKNL